MSDTPLHCDRPMRDSVMSKHSPVPAHRSRPIWICVAPGCMSWQPRDGWQGPLPEGWDGEHWNGDQ